MRRIWTVVDRRGAVWAVGVIIPTVMFLVGYRAYGAASLFGSLKPFASVGIGAVVVAIVWTLLRQQPSAFLAGVIGVASWPPIALGAVLLAFVIHAVVPAENGIFAWWYFDWFKVALFFGLSGLGLGMLLGGIVIRRHACRLYDAAPPGGSPARYYAGAAALVGICVIAQWFARVVVNTSVEDICSAQPERNAIGLARLARWRLLVDAETLAARWEAEDDAHQTDCLATAYRQITGREVELERD